MLKCRLSVNHYSILMSHHVFLVLTFKTLAMKKVAILSMTVLLAMSFIPLAAQDVNKDLLKSKIKSEKSEIKTEKKEVKAIKEELHKLVGGIIPKLTMDAFITDFGNIPDAKWKRTIYFDEVVFTKDGKEMKAYYDSSSKLVGTTMTKTFEDMPVSAQKEINKKYKDYTVKRVVFFDDNEFNETDMLLWNTQFADSDNYFVVMTKDKKEIVLQVNANGEVNFFKEL